jgi:drug/metabolite transporter (DMT)-like permease
MSARVILLGIAATAAVLAIARWRRHRGALRPQERTWLLLAAIFGAVSAYLFFTQP